MVLARRTQREIRILIADDHPLVRDGLQTLLATQSDFIVVGTASDGTEALRLAAALAPDVLLLDLSMPGLSGLDVMREMKKADGAIGCRTILLTAAFNRSDITRALQHGARGVVLKNAPMDLLYKSIRKVHEGELWVDRETMGAVVDTLVASDGQPPPASRFGLTPRERDVLRLVVEGDSNKSIAQRLAVGEDTVKHHLTSIFDKTGVSNRLELAVFALHHELVSAK